jgi:hypothetical protein
MQHLPKQPGGHLIPQVGHPPIALWDINYGLELTAGGTIVGWRDVIGGAQACPGIGGMVTETTRFSGSRRAVSFNGTTQALCAVLPQLRRTAKDLALYVQMVAADDIEAERSVVKVISAAAVIRLEIRHTGTETEMGIIGAEGSLEDSAYAWNLSEMVVGAARVANVRAQWWTNGTSMSTTSDTTAITSLFDEVIVGGSFYGSIRRIAIYNQPHTTTEAAIIDAAWRGL